jgi:6-phosphofructokinase 1
MSTPSRLAILTSGGDAPGMNAVIAGACDRIEALGLRAYGVLGGFAGLADGRIAALDPVEARSRAHEPGTWLGTSRWPRLTTAEGVRACGAALAAGDIDGLLVVGGHGSAEGARALEGALPAAFVPATIDRDITGTGATIGMDSAIGYALDAIDRLRVTGRSLPGRAFVVQTLGAPNGYLADAVAAAAGIEEVLVPERSYDLDDLGRRLRDKAHSGAAIAVMSEAVGDAVDVAAQLAARAGVRVHPTILGHAQRAATPTPFDRAAGHAAGHAAVDELASGRSAFVAIAAGGAVAARPLSPNFEPAGGSPSVNLPQGATP